jgi:hypothetical protein
MNNIINNLHLFRIIGISETRIDSTFNSLLKQTNELSDLKENLFQKLNEQNQKLSQNEEKEKENKKDKENIDKEQKSLLNEENQNQYQNQNSDYKKIYENIKKIKQQLSLLEIFRIILITFMSLCIYFDIYKSENSKIMFFSTFILLESSLFILIRCINGNKVILFIYSLS